MDLVARHTPSGDSVGHVWKVNVGTMPEILKKMASNDTNFLPGFTEIGQIVVNLTNNSDKTQNKCIEVFLNN